MNHHLPKLPYEKDALKPYISEETLEYHYGKHHQGYVDKLNGMLPGSKFEDADLITIIKNADGGIFNNAAQVWNHTFYFESFSADGRREPAGELAEAINASFGSFDKFREEFGAAAASLFGSGWAWLVKNNNGSLSIVQKANAENPLCDGLKPVLTCDVWEHAYYIDYRNKRPEYIKSFWEIIDWDIIASRY
ncbi:MAG: superoxide dismutase [Bacteroidales bacterium]|jgi:Fe-Mn family superoxide dismutase|nr:superoxide dismutase [Bacteroidales bacterium]